jgi:5'-AMP-activated protein kinase, regulatory gamma subunit
MHSSRDAASANRNPMSSGPGSVDLGGAEREQLHALQSIREFLKRRTSYDVMPLSYRLILLDSALTIKASLGVMTQMGIVSAPMWDSKTSTFAGLITANDYINVVQYFWQNPDKIAEIDKMRLKSLPSELSYVFNANI